ncbi:MAG: formylglycine-generating enzyme family protein [Kiritimatiellia bacterium]|nr:formylglycine-generating enzyme family protein [Lentisphaerota bacterium]
MFKLSFARHARPAVAGLILTWLLASVLAGAQQPRREHGDIFRLQLDDPAEALELVWIEAMGLWVGRHEVTNGQYRRYNLTHMPAPYYENNVHGRRQPAVRVSWIDADNYAAWLNRNFADQIPAGFAFRLPSEREWTDFAICGRAKRYPWGDRWPPPDDWNYRGEEGLGLLYRLFEKGGNIRGHDDGFIVAAPVEESGRNAWGLYGVGGNVWEWCRDWFDDEQRYRSLRGAGWNNYEEPFLRVNHRGRARPEQKNAMVGFRLVLAPSGQPAAAAGNVD